MKAMYRYATAMLGAQCVMIIGILVMLMWSVVSLDYKVRHTCIYYSDLLVLLVSDTNSQSDCSISCCIIVAC